MSLLFKHGYTITSRHGQNPPAMALDLVPNGPDGKPLPVGQIVGHPVLALVTGRIHLTGIDPEGGLYAIIKEDGVERYWYTGHHQDVKVKRGDRVTKGKAYATVGFSGLTRPDNVPAGAHVHLQLRGVNNGPLINVETALIKLEEQEDDVAEKLVSKKRLLMYEERLRRKVTPAVLKKYVNNKEWPLWLYLHYHDRTAVERWKKAEAEVERFKKRNAALEAQLAASQNGGVVVWLQDQLAKLKAKGGTK